jgi:spore coat protein U-like protein
LLNMKNAFRLLAAGALLAAGLPIAAYAQSSPQTTNLNVSATVASVCLLTAPANIAFGSVTALAPANASGSVTVTCNKGAVVSATTTSANFSGTQKRMRLGASTDYLDYQVWQPDLAAPGTCAAVQTDWTGSVTLTSLWSASGGPRTIAVCATTTPNTGSATGTYTDTLTVSVSFS